MFVDFREQSQKIHAW